MIRLLHHVPVLPEHVPLLIGYMRISTGEQSLDLQRDALARAGCERTYQDIASGSAVDRPGLARALEQARSGDTLVVWKLLYSGKLQ